MCITRQRKKGFDTKADAQAFRIKKIKEYGIHLTPDQENGIKYIEGEGNDYTNKRRVMNELAAFCHVCDVSSARIGPDNPFEKNDPWPGAERLKKPSKK